MSQLPAATDLPANASSLHPNASSVHQNAPLMHQNAPSMHQNAPSVSDPISSLTPSPAAASDSPPPPPCTINENSASLLSLSPLQQQAIELLLSGQTCTAIAHKLKIDRATLYRWRTHHPRFIAELSRRSRLAQLDASLAARHALDLSTKIIIKQLRTQPKRSSELAQRLICSPRLARLAATAPSSSLREVLADLRTSRQPAPDDADQSALLDDLAAELSAPLPPEPPVKSKEPTITDRFAHLPPRQPLVDALAPYRQKIPVPIAEAIARRPDLHPLDIHYALIDAGWIDQCAINLSTAPLAGTLAPLSPWILCKLAKAGHLKQIAGHSLSTYHVEAQGHCLLLTHGHTNATITLPPDRLWRDALIP